MRGFSKSSWLAPIARGLVLLAAAVSLAGCVVYPYGPHYYRPAPYYYR